MTAFEEQEGFPGEEQGEEARALFRRTVAEARPQLGFTAEDLVLGGRRRVRRRRVAAMVGSTASVAAIAVAATAFASGGGSRAAATPTTRPAGGFSDEEKTALERELAGAVFADMLGKLDPSGKHITAANPYRAEGKFMPNTGVCDAMPKIQETLGIDANWTADGTDPLPRPQNATSPYIQVSIQVTDPHTKEEPFAAVDWGPITRSRLPDGSTLQAASAAAGHRLRVVRTMPNHQEIIFTAADDSTLNAPGEARTKPTNPFPFTTAQLAAIVSGESLPLPFSDDLPARSSCDFGSA